MDKKDKIIGTIVGIVMVFMVIGMIYLAIKHPRPHPGYDHQLPPTYSPWPIAQINYYGKIGSCIKNPKWCYKNERIMEQNNSL